MYIFPTHKKEKNDFFDNWIQHGENVTIYLSCSYESDESIVLSDKMGIEEMLSIS